MFPLLKIWYSVVCRWIIEYEALVGRSDKEKYPNYKEKQPITSSFVHYESNADFSEI